MEQSPSWEANGFAASQEILRILWNPKVHHRIHECPPPVPILITSIQSIPPHPTSWRSILILSSHLGLGLPSCLFPSGFPTKTLYTPLFSPTRATCPAHLILHDFITRTILGEEYGSLTLSFHETGQILNHLATLDSQIFREFCFIRPNIFQCLFDDRVNCWSVHSVVDR